MADSMPPLRIFTFGAPEVRLGENLISFSTRKTLALLIYLAIEPGLQPREHLAALLWPEANPERSRANLRNTLGHLQRALRQASGQAQTAYLHVSHDALGLNPDAMIDLDLHTIEQAYTLVRADRLGPALPKGSANLPLLQSAVARQRGSFLVGFSLGDAPDFDDWAATQREVWHRRLGLILDRLSEIQFVSGEFAGAAETASRWIALDTLNEVAYRRKMRAHFTAGERGQALETYENCRARLTAELGVEPEPDTEALAVRIRTQLSIQRTLPQPGLPETSVNFLGNLFAGRSREFQSLMNSYERAATGEPQLVVLRGEAGIGKTRLARKFLAAVQAQGAELLQGSAFESGSHLPFQPLVEALRPRLKGKNSIRDLLDDVGLSTLSQLLPELNDSSPGISQDSREHGTQRKQTSQSRLFESFVQLTLALAQNAPLVLFVDDLQWSDSATLDLLHYAIRRWRGAAALQAGAARVLLLVSLRSEALHPMTQPQLADRLQGSSLGLMDWLDRIKHELTPVHLELEPLNESESVQMVLSILSPPDPSFARWLSHETRGQPFYLIETLKDLLERRVLRSKRQAEGRWTFSVNTEHDLNQAVRVPSSVHAVIRSRLNRLSPKALSLLASGAVLEQHITFERLHSISSIDEDLALPALDELISLRFLVETEQPDAASDYVFVNDMLRDVVYTEAGDARRRLFHKRALELLEASEESAALLAHHAFAAGLAQSAFHHSLAAGREALRLSALSEAIVHFEHARQFVHETPVTEMQNEPDIHDLYILLSQAYELTGQTEKALTAAAEHNRLHL